MRVERLSRDKIRFFLSMDDLMERGIEKEDMWRDIPKVHELFNDMMDQAYQSLASRSPVLSPWKYSRCQPKGWWWWSRGEEPHPGTNWTIWTAMICMNWK